MDSKYVPLVIGGLIPALFYGVASVFQKLSVREGGSVSVYLLAFGAATFLVGALSTAFLPHPPSPIRSILIAGLGGVTFALGAGLISLALVRYDAALAQLAPLYNMNLLVSVTLGLLLFSEFKDLQVSKVLVGTVLILAGGWLVSSA